MSIEIAPSQDHEFDVALSFAGEDRPLVSILANGLKENGIRVFYDEDYQSDLWGRDLVAHLDDVYRRRSRYTIVFISRHYVAKNWTNHERRSAQARAFADDDVYLLPVRLDETTLPGLPDTVGYLDARKMDSAELCRLFVEKLGSSRSPNTSGAVERTWYVPRNISQITELLEKRPETWEYLLFAGWLYVKTEELENQFRDYEIGYADASGPHFDSPHEAARFASISMQRIGRIVDSAEKIYSTEAQARALGEPGVPGSPDAIEHLTQRATDLYSECMRIAANLRSATGPEGAVEYFEATAAYVDDPIQSHRRMVNQMVEKFDTLYQTAVLDGQPFEWTHVLKWDVSKEHSKAFDKSLSYLRLRSKRNC